MNRILIFEHTTTFLLQWLSVLVKEGYLCRAIETQHEFVESMHDFQPSAILIGLNAKDRAILELLPEIKKQNSDIPILVFSKDKMTDLIVDSIKMGAWEFIELPLSQKDFIAHINRVTSQARQVTEAPPKPVDQSRSLPDVIGQSEETEKIACRIFKIAPLDVNVMIYGETGTGKELFARSLHKISNRVDKPFIAVDCVSLPPNLNESELFGHEQGAFTGATKMKKGLLELADGGTLFLDEITELDFYLQGKLLRVLQEQQFRRVGGNELINVDLRVVSATNRNPEQAVEEGKLRKDLYYRLNVVPIHIPSLRERREDITHLVEYYIKEINQSNEIVVSGITKKAMNALMEYDWPGNVRELQNVILQIASLSDSEMIDVSDLPHYIVSRPPVPSEKSQKIVEVNFKDARDQHLRQFCQTYFDEILEKYQGNISRVAREAQISRGTIYKLFKDFNLKNDYISI